MRRIFAGRRPARADTLDSLRRYTRYTLATAVLVMVAPAGYSLVSAPLEPVLTVVLSVGLAVLATTHWRRVSALIHDPSLPLSWRRLLPTVLLSLTLNCLALGQYPAGLFWVFPVGMSVTETLFGPGPSPAWARAVSVAAACGLSTAGVVLLAGPASGRTWWTAVWAVGILLALGYGEWLGLRQWKLTLDLDRARRDAADLAATRERLRLAEDLHDILGHALEVVSLKSELATRLAKADPDRALAEMAEVQRLARGALHDVRELARGRRATDLAAEVFGARNLLAAAGVAYEFGGRPDSLGPVESELLGRVLREAVTNLLRHSDASTCVVDLEVTVDSVRLRVVNDGAAPLRGAGDGSGLRGLARRVDEVGGTFSARPVRADSFEVTAVLPRQGDRR